MLKLFNYLKKICLEIVIILFNHFNLVFYFKSLSFFNASASEPMTVSEEVAHLRQQMGRVTRRVIELEHAVSLPFYVREKKLIVSLICGYLVLKFSSWLTRR